MDLILPSVWKFFLKKYGPIPASFSFIFVLFVHLQIEENVDGVLGIRTRRRMVGADETTELWRPPMLARTYHIFSINYVLLFAAPKLIQISIVKASVTRLVDFLKFLALNFLTKATKYLVTSTDLSKNITFL